MSSRIVQVGLLTSYLRELVETDEFMQDMWVEGEVSSYTVAGSGHAYFAIKDASAAVDCVMWKPTRVRQSFAPRVGDKIVVHGSATVYERNSRFQIKADVVYPAGAGILQLQLELLKQRLEAEGLFDESRKRPLPLYPRRIGVVTSATGAVWHDIQRVVQRRYPLVELVLSPAVVQGDRAPESVVLALQLLQDSGVDLVIVARGGGSAEDLWAFNDERIARAIFASRVPIVSAIGHETDVTIADYVADVRAATPSVAAELVVPDLAAIAYDVEELRERALMAALATVSRSEREIAQLQHRIGLSSPLARLESMRLALTAIRRRLHLAGTVAIERKRNDVGCQVAVLEALDPHAILGRGYAHIARDSSGEPVRQAGMLAAGDVLRATFADSSVRATVIGETRATGSHT